MQILKNECIFSVVEVFLPTSVSEMKLKTCVQCDQYLRMFSVQKKLVLSIMAQLLFSFGLMFSVWDETINETYYAMSNRSLPMYTR